MSSDAEVESLFHRIDFSANALVPSKSALLCWVIVELRERQIRTDLQEISASQDSYRRSIISRALDMRFRGIKYTFPSLPGKAHFGPFALLGFHYFV